jgi:hypothetical protein
LPKENKLISQLGDGAAVNVAAKIDKASMKKLSKLGLKFMNACSTDPNAAKKMDEWNQIIEESVDSVGQILSCSVRGNTMGKPPFIVEYILEVKDKQKYDKMVDKSAEMMTSGSWSKMYKDMGMDMSFDVQRGVGEYKGIPIDNAKLSMKMTDTNSPKGQMIQMMYGDGFDYRYAYADGLYLTTLGGDPDGTVKKMIDSVKAGFNKQPGSEMTAAITLLGGAKDADFVGTINYIRLIGMITNFVPAPMPIPFDKIPTKSNIAFAGKGDNGKLVVDVAVPKEHIMEFVTGMQMLMQPPQGGTGTIQ